MRTAQQTWLEGRRTRAWTVTAVGLSVAGAAGVAAALAGPVGVVGLIAAALLAWSALHRPGLLFGAFLMIPFYKAALNPYSPVDITVLLAIANGAQLLWVLRFGMDRLRAPGIVLWLVMAAIVVAGVTYTTDQSGGLWRAATWLALVVMPSVAAIRVASDVRHVRDLLAVAFAMGSTVVAFGLLGLAGGGAEPLVVLGENTLQVASAALFVPIIGVAYILQAGWPPLRVLVVLAVPLALIVAVATGSRGPLLALALLAGVALAARVISTRRIGRGEIAVLVLGGVSLAAVFIVADRLPELSLFRFERLFDAIYGSNDAVGDNSIATRARLFDTAVELFAQRPLIGHGTGSFETYAAGSVVLAEYSYPHNLFLQTAAEFGLLGLIVLGLLVVLGLLARLPAHPAWTAVRLLFAFGLLTSMGSGDLYGARELWGTLILVLAAPIPRPAVFAQAEPVQPQIVTVATARPGG